MKNSFILRKINNLNLLIPEHKCPENLFCLNSTGLYVWKKLKKGLHPKEIADLMTNKFKIPLSKAQKDIQKFIFLFKNKKYKKITNYQILGKNEKARIPIHGSIDLTNKCNLKCIHCYLKNSHKNQNNSWSNLRRYFREIINEGCLFLQLTGGEILTRPDFKKIYLYVRKNGLIPTIMTNATLINDDLIQTFKKYPPYCIKISLYGSNAFYHDKITGVKGSFNKSLSNIIKLKKEGIKIWINAVILKENFADLSDIVKLIQKIETPANLYPFLIPSLNGGQEPLKHQLNVRQCLKVLKYSKEILPNHVQQKKNSQSSSKTIFPCNAGKNSFHIDNQGKLFICKIERSTGISLSKMTFKKAWKKLEPIRLQKLYLPSFYPSCKLKSDCQICPPLLKLYKSSGKIPIKTKISLLSSSKSDTGKG